MEYLQHTRAVICTWCNYAVILFIICPASQGSLLALFGGTRKSQLRAKQPTTNLKTNLGQTWYLPGHDQSTSRSVSYQ